MINSLVVLAPRMNWTNRLAALASLLGHQNYVCQVIISATPSQEGYNLEDVAFPPEGDKEMAYSQEKECT